MPLIRTFRGRVVKRTRRRGRHVEVILQSAQPGEPGERLVVPLGEFLRDREARFSQRGDHPPGHTRNLST